MKSVLHNPRKSYIKRKLIQSIRLLNHLDYKIKDTTLTAQKIINFNIIFHTPSLVDSTFNHWWTGITLIEIIGPIVTASFITAIDGVYVPLSNCQDRLPSKHPSGDKNTTITKNHSMCLLSTCRLGFNLFYMLYHCNNVLCRAGFTWLIHCRSL